MRITINEDTMTLTMAKGAKAWMKEHQFFDFMHDAIDSQYTVVKYLGVDDVQLGTWCGEYAYSAYAYAMVVIQGRMAFVKAFAFFDGSINFTEYKEY